MPESGSPAVAPAAKHKGVVAVAKFDGTSGSGLFPDTENFDGSGSYTLDDDANIVSCDWDFGDGASASGCKAAHTFPSAGFFIVTLTVTDSDGNRAQDSLEVTVVPRLLPPPPPPSNVTAVAKFDGTSGSGVAPDNESFDGTASTSSDPHATISCVWVFGDGTSASGCKVSHTFATAGTFTVTLAARDSDGASDHATLAVQTTAAPTPSIRWVRSGIGGTVGSDFSGAAVNAAHGLLERFDPADGHTLWRVSFDSQAGQYYDFGGRLFIGPDGGPIFATHWDGTAAACTYSVADGSQLSCFDSDSHGVDGEMGAGGEMASLHLWIYSESVVVRRTDGSTWTINPGPGMEIESISTEPGGDALIAATTYGAASYGGRALPDGHVLLRIHDDGSLVWWRPLPFQVGQMSTSAIGTVVLLGIAPSSFTWAGQQEPAGTYLATIEHDSSDRWVRPLLGEPRHLAVLPAGQAAVADGLPNCGGGVVYRYNLAGDQLWAREFGELGCDGSLDGVAILPDDVIVSGFSARPVTIGSTDLPTGGFLLDIAGP